MLDFYKAICLPPGLLLFVGLLGLPDATASAETTFDPVNVGYAELAQKASSAVRAQAPQAAQLKKKMDEQIAQNEQVKKTYDDTFNALRAYDGALAEYDRDLNAYESDLAVFETDNNNYLARLNDYTARCLSGQLDEGSYNTCVAEQGGLNAEYNALEPRKLDLDRRQADLEVRSSTLNSKVQTLRADLENYAQMMKRIFAEWEENKRKLDQVSGELEGLRSQLANFCGSVEQIQNTDEDALEALKHCSSLGWDGTRKSLPSVQFWIEQASAGGWGGLTVTPNQ